MLEYPHNFISGPSTYRLSLFQLSLQRKPFSVEFGRTPVGNLMDAALGQVLLHLVQTHELAEAVVGSQCLFQGFVFPLVLYRLNESSEF